MHTLQEALYHARLAEAFAAQTAEPRVVAAYAKGTAAKTRQYLEEMIAESEPDPEPEPEPAPEPNPDSRLLWTGNRTTDWDDKLIEASGATITDTALGIKVAIPGPSSASYRRCELASYSTSRGASPIPGDRIYEWDFMVPGHVNLSTKAGDDNNHTNQMKSNNNAGYTGGVDIRPNGQVLFVVSPDSENHEFVFGNWRPDTWHKVRLNVSWRKDASGSFTASLDGKVGASATKIKTSPQVADKMYLRLGIYPADVPAPELAFYYRNVRVEIPNS